MLLRRLSAAERIEPKGAHNPRYSAARGIGPNPAGAPAKRGYRLAPNGLRIPVETTHVGYVGDDPLSRLSSGACTIPGAGEQGSH